MSRTIQIAEREKLAHSPTLNTVMMVEEVLKNIGELVTLIQILDYLQLSGKIIIGTKGILWVFAERKELNELIKRGTEV